MASRARPPALAGEAHPVAELKEAFGYVWSKPDLLGAFAMAFLVNLLAFPFVLGLLPYVAKDVYAVGQAGLGYLAASFWIGALLGSLVVGDGGAAAARRARDAVERRALVRGDSSFRPEHRRLRSGLRCSSPRASCRASA